MAIVPKWYLQGMKAVMGGAVDIDTDTFKLTLHTATYSPNLDTDDFYNDATNELSTANGYTAGGVTLAGVGLTTDAASDQVRVDWTDPAWTFTGSQTWRYGVIRKARGGAASADELVALLEWDSNQTVSTPYTVVLDPAGLLYVDVTPP